MNPQSWLDAFVLRNRVDLARMREYCEQSLAVAMAAEREKRPRPARVEGGVVATDVRDRILLAAENPVFTSGNFTRIKRPNRSVCLREKTSGVEVRMRKIKEPPACDPGLYRERVTIQPMIFSSAEDALSPGLTPVILWSIDGDDLLGDFHAAIVTNVDELNRSVVTVCALTEVPLLASLQIGTVGPGGDTTRDDFGDLVNRRRPRQDESTGDAAPQT